MIAVCPKCSARYRVDTTRIGPEGAKLRCSKCSALFLVRVPAQAAQPTAASAPSDAATVESVSRAEAGVGGGGAEARGRLPLVLVADRDAARGKSTAGSIEAMGLAVKLVHDGVEAMLALQRMLPEVAVLDASLPRMNGGEICEIVKRNASLRSIRVVLIESAAAAPGEAAALGFGPDDRLEGPDLPDALGAILKAQGLASRTAQFGDAAPKRAAPAASPGPSLARPASARAPTATPVATPTAAPVAPAARSAAPSAAPVDAAREEERERARRLARIAVSEMLLYQPEKFAQACRDGTLERALEVEIQEARALIRQRIGPEVRAEADFVLEELHRVARERGATA